MDHLTAGAIAMGCFIAGLFFLRFWRDSRDRLFLLFALAFFVMGINRIGLELYERPDWRAAQYWVRLLAFSLLLVAILDKNRPRRR
jgi:hypothetical protein